MDSGSGRIQWWRQLPSGFPTAGVRAHLQKSTGHYPQPAALTFVATDGTIITLNPYEWWVGLVGGHLILICEFRRIADRTKGGDGISDQYEVDAIGRGAFAARCVVGFQDARGDSFFNSENRS